MNNKVLNFKYYIFKENIKMLGSKIGDIISNFEKAIEQYDVVGLKTSMHNIAEISADIRSLIQGHMATENKKYMKELQKIGVALEKMIENKQGDSKKTLEDCASSLKNIAKEIGVPLNDIGVAPEETLQDKQQKDKTNTVKSTDLDINPQAKPVSGFDLGNAPALGSPPEVQNPNSI